MLSISDNNYQGVKIQRNEISDLLPLGNKPLKTLCSEHDGLLIFPPQLAETDDRIGDEPIFCFSYGETEEDVVLYTTNVMGFMGRGRNKLRIFSRFDQENKHDYFLHYMLQRVFSINLFDFETNRTDEDVFDLLPFLFPHYLKAAMQQGVFREYVRFQHNNANVRGTIDLARHIRHNIPYNGHIAYNTREYSRDNSMTQLIRHTIEHIRQSRYAEAILQQDADTKACVKDIVELTPSYSRSRRQQVIQKNLRPSSHPYFTDYLPLKDLCLRILRWDEIKNGDADDDFVGILFDGAWLWEEYCNTILHDYGFVHPENKKWKHALYLFTDHTCPRYPDFYREDKGLVVDAKYKKYGEKEKMARVGGDDLHQIITYMFRLKAHYGAFLSPFQEGHDAFVSAHLEGYGGEVAIWGIEIPQTASSYSDFCAMMHANEDRFKSYLNEKFFPERLL